MLFLTLTFPMTALAEWCSLNPGFEVVTHGTQTDSVFILGTFVGRNDGLWITISDGTTGKFNASLALAAELAGKSIAVYLDSSEYTCANFPSWAAYGGIRHIKIL